MINESEIVELYFQWLLNIVCDDKQQKEYENLIRLLHSIEFYSTLQRDDHRAADGIDLRAEFADSIGVDYMEIRDILMEPCSVLEMFVALALRCENSIMGDDEYGDRTSEWFWLMMHNMRLDEFTNYVYDEYDICEIVERFMLREYQSDGFGGPFYIPGTDKDLRDVELWYQMCWYLNTIL